jgi:DNA-directed RNA polymerase sigma subunit (sigma70/sigma32)
VLELYNKRNADSKINDTNDIVNVEYVYIDNAGDDDRKTQYTKGITDFNTASMNDNMHLTHEQKEFNHEITEAMLSMLTQKEQFIIRRIFGIGMDMEWSVSDVADELKISTQRVNQIRCAAINKLKKNKDKLHYSLA